MITFAPRNKESNDEYTTFRVRNDKGTAQADFTSGVFVHREPGDAGAIQPAVLRICGRQHE